MIIRLAIRDSGYAQIDNRTLRDEALSFKARGILGLLLSFRDDWEGSLDGLVEMAPDGRDAIRAGVRELEEAGYIVRSKFRDDGGRWRTVLTVLERPSEDGKSDVTMTGNPSRTGGSLTSDDEANPQVATMTGLPASEKPSLSTKTKPSTEDQKTKILAAFESPSCGFEDFWKAYPKRRGKGAARDAWTKRTRAGADPGHLVQRAGLYAQYVVAALQVGEIESMHFVPWPQKWLREERDQDELTNPGRAPASVSKIDRARAEHARRYGNGQAESTGSGGYGDGRVGLGDGSAGHRDVGAHVLPPARP